MKRLLLFAALILAAAGCSKDDTSSPTPSGWDGTPATEFANGDYDDGKNDYDIATASQLAYLAELVSTDGNTMSDKTFTLTANINLNNVEWTPIGNETTKFQGTFDGDGYTISGLKIDNDTDKYIGLIGYVSDATIKNISVAGSVKSSKDSANIGGVVGCVSNSGTSTIINCYSSVAVEGNGTRNYIGGVVGQTNGASNAVTNCYSSGDIKGDDSNASVGGVVGSASSSTITNCYSSGSVTGTYVGGVVGSSGSATITNCYWNSENITNCTGSGTSDSDSNGMTAAKMKESSFVVTLNVNATTYNDGTGIACAWKSGSNGYPTLDFDVVPNIVAWDGSTATSFEGEIVYADGTSSYTIATASQLAYLAKLVNTDNYNMSDKTFTLTINIYLNNMKWTPIGNSTTKFQGTFDGGEHTISGLYIDYDNTDYYVGLFGYAYDATIKNIAVSGSVTNNATSGADTPYVGGVAGSANSATLTNCYSSVAVSGGEGAYVGGVAGYANSATLTNCYSSGDIEGGEEAFVGGVAGSATNSATLTNCYSSVAVSGGESASVGGVAGSVSYSATLTNCYSSGDVDGGESAKIGGVAGVVSFSATLTNCYSSGDVDGGNQAFVGGVAGSTTSSVSYQGTTIEYCYWNSTISGVSVAYGIDTNTSYPSTFTNNVAKTTAEMQATGFVTLLNNNVTRYNSANPAPAVMAYNWKAVSGGYPTFDL